MSVIVNCSQKISEKTDQFPSLKRKFVVVSSCLPLMIGLLGESMWWGGVVPCIVVS